MKRYLWLFISLLYFIGCTESSPTAERRVSELPMNERDSMQSERFVETDISVLDTLSPEILKPDTSELERSLIAQGLIDIQSLSPDIQVDLKYSSTNNFLGKDVYGTLNTCYLQPEVAQMLAQAQAFVKEEDPELNLLVFDGVRPRSVQLQMWEIVKGTPQQDYVAPPNGGGSMHNYGAAVDLGLIREDGTVIDMGTPFDFFGPMAQPRYETQYLQSGELTQEQAQNRWLLRNAMKKAGFHIILSEWWHFNAYERKETRMKFKIIE